MCRPKSLLSLSADACERNRSHAESNRMLTMGRFFGGSGGLGGRKSSSSTKMSQLFRWKGNRALRKKLLPMTSLCLLNDLRTAGHDGHTFVLPPWAIQMIYFIYRREGGGKIKGLKIVTQTRFNQKNETLSSISSYSFQVFSLTLVFLNSEKDKIQILASFFQMLQKTINILSCNVFLNTRLNDCWSCITQQVHQNCTTE